MGSNIVKQIDSAGGQRKAMDDSMKYGSISSMKQSLNETMDEICEVICELDISPHVSEQERMYLYDQLDAAVIHLDNALHKITRIQSGCE